MPAKVDDKPSYVSLNMRVPAEWLEKLDQWRSEQLVAPSRVDVVRLAVLQFIDQHPTVKKR